MTALNELTAHQAAQAIRDRACRSEDLVAACLERIESREAEVGAWAYLDGDAALKAARDCDRKRADGPLHGVPVAIKDIIDTADMPTALGTSIYAGRRPSWDAACVSLIRQAGGVVLGKTVTTELAYFAPGKTRNPHNLDHTPGGSSSGTAAAVADFMVPVGLGTQTAASVIRPAAFCGVTGYKGSHGTFSLAGIRPFAESLDSLGVISRCVADARLLRSVLRRQTTHQRDGRSHVPWRLGMCRTPHWQQASEASQSAFDKAADVLSNAGADIAELDLPTSFDDLADHHVTVMAWEAAANYAYEHHAHRLALSDHLVALLDRGAETPEADYVIAKRRIADCAEHMAVVWNAHDVIVTPSAPGEAPHCDAGTGDPIFCRMWTALGLPAITIPIDLGPQGLPLGIQFIGPIGEDELLLDVALWAESLR